MRCRDAKYWLTAQRERDLEQPGVSGLDSHLQKCPPCRDFELRQERLDTILTPEPSRSHPSISTERIMRAVEQQRQVTRQLEHLRAQQQGRLAYLHASLKGLGIACLLFGLFSLLFAALSFFQPDVLVKLLELLSDSIAFLVIIAQAVQTGLTLITFNNWLLSGAALMFVLLLGMWLRLMRYPQGA